MADIGIRVIVAGVAEARRNIGAIQSDINGLQRTIEQTSGTTSQLGHTLQNVGSAMIGVGRTLTIAVTAPIAAIGTAAIQAGIDFEDAFAGVGKTVDGVMTPMGELTDLGMQLREEFRELALELPMATNEIANLGELVGQLGVSADDVTEVTEIIAQLGATTELSAEDAATGLIKFNNILNGTTGDIVEFLESAGSALVALGNASVSTEGDILNIGLRLAAAGDRAKFSGQEILAWATTLSDLGVRAEAGGSAVSRAINEMMLAVETGSDNLATFASVTGQTVDQFVQAFEQDASGALLNFVTSLEAGIRAGDVTVEMLNDLGLSGIRSMDILGRLGDAQDIFNKNLDIANQAWREQVALQEEFNKRAATVKSQIQILKNAFTDLGITIFDLVKDDLVALINGIKQLISDFKNLDPGIQKAILQFALIAAAVGPALIVLGTLVTGIGLFISALVAIASPAGLAAGAILLVSGALAAIAIPNMGAIFGDLDSLKEKALEVARALGFVADRPIQSNAPNAVQAEQAATDGIVKNETVFEIPDFDTFIQGLKDLGGADVENVINSINRIGASLGNIFDTFSSNPQVQKNLEDIAKNFSKLGESLKDFSIGALDSIAEFFEENEDRIAEAAGTLLSLGKAVQTLAVGFIDVAAIVGGGGLDAFLSIISALADLANGDFEGALGNLKVALAEVIVAGQGAGEAMQEAGHAVAEALAGDELPTAVESWSGNMDNVNAIITQLAVNAGTGMSLFAATVSTGFNLAVTGAAGFIGNMLGTGIAFIQAAIDGVASGVGTFVGNIVSTFASAVASALSFVGSMGAAGASFMMAAVTSVIDRGKALLNAASTAASNAAAAFIGLVGSFAAAGAAFIQGAIGGIQSLVGALVAAAAGAASEAAGAFMGALQIQSPSKVLFEAGKFFMEGAILGIDSQIQSLSNVASTAASNAADAFVTTFAPDDIMSSLSLALSGANTPASSIVNNNNATNFNFGDISGVPMTQETDLPNLLVNRLTMLGAG